MAVQSETYRKPRARKNLKVSKNHEANWWGGIREAFARSLVRNLPGYLILAGVLAIILPNALSATFSAAVRGLNALPATVNRVIPLPGYSSTIAPLFTPEVEYWSEHLRRWGAQYNLDPNLLATVMQIESCGFSSVSSSAGAQGLFQVMPFHFAAGENQIDPETNAMRGANHLNDCLGWSNGDPGLAMACYNGGPSVLQRAFANWPAETQRYYNWGRLIYQDAQQNLSTSATLDQWLNAGGSVLCNRAANALGLR
jgi:soluble lytic murein transglycosylase-like protein